MTDDPLRAALEAVLRRDDLCDDTDGEHHTDEYVAAFLNALDTELAGRAALAASAPDEGRALSAIERAWSAGFREGASFATDKSSTAMMAGARSYARGGANDR